MKKRETKQKENQMRIKRLGYSINITGVMNEAVYDDVIVLASKLQLEVKFTNPTTLKVTGSPENLSKFYKSF